jgi:predicted ATPase
MHYRLFAPLNGTLLAEREAEAGRVEAGLATLDGQVVAIEENGQHWFDAEVHRARGELLLKLRRPDVAAAEGALMRAIEIARGQQTRTFELRAALSLAKLYKTTGRDQLAGELLAPALIGFNAGPEVPEVEEAQRLLTMREPDRRFGRG